MLVASLSNFAHQQCPGATGTSAQGEPRQEKLSPGPYEIRVVGGDVIVKQGSPPFAPDDLVVSAGSPWVGIADGLVSVAATTSASADVYISPLVPA